MFRQERHGLCGPAISSSVGDLASARSLVLLALLSLIALLVQGYHFGTDDAAIYIPAVERFVTPQLFPYGAPFFLSHAHMSIFSDLVGSMVRYLHVPLPWAILGFHLLGIFLLLLGGHWLARLCFTSRIAIWAATLMLASVLPTPVAGVALPIMDPYLTARSLSTPVTVLALAAFLARRPLAATVLLAITALLHPLMAVYGIALVGLLSLSGLQPRAVYREEPVVASAAVLWRLPAGFHLGPAQEPYRQTLYSRTFLFAWAWGWYEWVGVLAPLAILFALTRLRIPALTPIASRLARALFILGIVSTAAFLLFSSSPIFDNFVRLQPMRSFQLIYIVMFVLLGGLVGEYLLQEKTWRWLLLFVPIAIGVFCVDRSVYPASRHLELPGRPEANPWSQAFRWVRENTPQDAVFALPPRYMLIPGEDVHGFRAIAERSMLADWVKDSGVASVFPQLAPEWARDQQLTQGWDTYKAADFNALATRSPVTWVIVQPMQAAGLDCPYHNAAAYVCRLSAPAASHAALQ